VGRLRTGPRNALVDVSGVRVGHRTLIEGDSVRTGVTAVLAHGDNVYEDKVLGGCHVINGYGKPAGLVQLAELGTVESPILLTSTLSVGAVWEGGLRYVLGASPDAGREGDTVNVIVGECFDGHLSDARGLHVRPEHALDALARASEEEVAEGSVGAGTGAICFGFKAGIGTASRLTEAAAGAQAHVLGCLLVANFGARRDLHRLLDGAPGGPADAPGEGGSVVAVLATDAPLAERQLRRLAARATFGLARAGSFAANKSGELAIAFSTAHRVPHRSERAHADFRFLRDDSHLVRQLFEAAAEVTEEAVLNSLCRAEAMEGRDGRRIEAFPYELLPR
jgi:D-aminopeptidase